MSSSPGPEPEDNLSFITTVIAALSQTLNTVNTPKTILLGLVLASVAKSVPSLGNPAKKKRRVEDLILLVAALAGALAGGLESSFSYDNPLSQTIVTAGLILALLGKTGLSLKSRNLEDEVAFGLSIASLAFLPLGNQYAWTGVFFGFLAKELLSPQPPQTVQADPSIV